MPSFFSAMSYQAVLRKKNEFELCKKGVLDASSHESKS
jgi:hypothetical protein